MISRAGRGVFVSYSSPVLAVLLGLMFTVAPLVGQARKKVPSKGEPSDRTYGVKHVDTDGITLDGSVDEEVWSTANLLEDVRLPWNPGKKPPATSFRAVYGPGGFFFSFDVKDADVVVRESIKNEKEIIHEDRVELFFARSPELETYYGLEIDPEGRPFSYQSTYYRDSDLSWDLPVMKLGSSISEDGYVVEGMIPLSFFVRNRLFSGTDDVRVMTGLFRAEFEQREGGGIKHYWMTWIDPETSGADFHRPQAFGWFVFEE